jgi:hypothetical protein
MRSSSNDVARLLVFNVQQLLAVQLPPSRAASAHPRGRRAVPLIFGDKAVEQPTYLSFEFGNVLLVARNLSRAREMWARSGNKRAVCNGFYPIALI